MVNSISLLSMDDLIKESKATVRTKDYIICAADKCNSYKDLNSLYRSDYFGIILITKGSCVYMNVVDNEECVLKENDISFCSPFETFKINYISDDYESKQIFFSANFISEAGFNYRSNDILQSLKSNSVNIYQELDLVRRLKFHIDELEHLNKPEIVNYYYNEMMWHHFSLLIYEIDNFFKRSGLTSHTSREEELATSFFSLVRENYKENHDVQYYADRLFVTRKYLSKIIKKTMNKTPREIISHILLVEAKILLGWSRATVNEVTTILNFSDQAVFSKFFKKHTGLTPSEYRKNDLF